MRNSFQRPDVEEKNAEILENLFNDVEEKKIDWDYWLTENNLKVKDLAYLLANQEPPLNALLYNHFETENCPPLVKRAFRSISIAIDNNELSCHGAFNDEQIETATFAKWLIKKGYKFSLPQEIWERFDLKQIGF